MDRANHKRIYFIPGIISLTILPFLFIRFASKELRVRSIGVITLFSADTNLPKKYPEAFEEYKGAFPPKRNYTDIILTGNAEDDSVKLGFAQIRIREILSANDSINALHFQFNDNSQYWTFVKAVDILRNEGAKTYMYLDKDVWFYHFPPDTTAFPDWICGITNDVFYERPETSWWGKATGWVTELWQSSWQIILTFAAFLLSIFLIRRQKTAGHIARS